jgi:hypothetical protein
MVVAGWRLNSTGGRDESVRRSVAPAMANQIADDYAGHSGQLKQVTDAG